MKARTWFFGAVGLILIGVLLFIIGYAVIYMNGYKLLVENEEKLNMAEASVVYDRNGVEFTQLYTQNRTIVTLDEVPDLLEEAIIATEDQRFYEHPGVDFWSIGRAIVKDIVARDLVEGGSTITQQLAKNMFLSADKTFFRKATEVSIALALENNFEKDEILEKYLNYIYYGNGVYGVQAAAEKHFGVSDLDDLSLLEIAVLAGMPKAPETYSPTNNPERALERASVVLKLMEDQGYITGEERREALNSKLRSPSEQASRKASAIKDYILAEASRVTGKSENELRIGGYQIYTSVDAKAQRAMDQAFANAELFPEDGPEQIAQGAMVIIDPSTGGIAAMNGGRDYVEKGLNRALVDRQPGSSFKPIASYAPALETGKWHPYSMLRDEKLTYGNYTPTNLSGKYQGEITMYEAVQRSINAPAVWLLNEIGVEKGLQFAQSLGIDMAKEDRNLAIALGGLTHGASPLEMARAYGAFANGGRLAETYVISEVKDAYGATIYKHEPKETRVMSEQTAYYMTYLLEGVTSKGGTGTRANFGRPVAGKTGTTQLGLKGVKDSAGNRDLWFVGYTPQYAAAVWMGFDKTDTEHYVKSGSGMAASMFATVMKEAMKDMEVRDFKQPSGVEEPKPEEKMELTPITDLSAVYDEEGNVASLSWSPAVTGGELEVMYRLYRKEAEETEFRSLLETKETLIADITLLPGKTYSYYVTVMVPEEEAESAPSNVIEVAVPEQGEGTDEWLDLPDLPEGEDGDEGQPNDEGGNGTEEGNGHEGGEGNGDGGVMPGTEPGVNPGNEPQPEPGAEPPLPESLPDPSELLPPPGL